MLIGGGHVVTNAHVLWPFQHVRVVFPDGTEFLDAPVLAWDLMGDLAVIGPLETDVEPVVLTGREDLVIGSDVYLIGYPGEAEEFPQPTITRGIISRLREWEPLEMTYFQTDASIAGGQSGGVLVSDRGDVIGTSGFSFTEAGFGLVASAADVMPRVSRLISGEDVAGLGDRRIPLEGGQLEHDLTLQNIWDTRLYVINEPAGTVVDIEVEGQNDVAFFVVDMFGEVSSLLDDGLTGVESGILTADLEAPYLLVVAQNLEESGQFHVSSSHNLAAYDDPDDGITVAVGQTFLATMDYPFDLDNFLIDLEEGDAIEITVDSLNIDPVLTVDFAGATEGQVFGDDDSGGGLFVTDAKLTYRAPHTGSYLIVVEDATGALVGGYFLTLSEASPDAAIVSPPPRPEVTTVDSPFGTMAVYESAEQPFSIQYPAEWIEQPPDPGITASFAANQTTLFAIAEDDLVAAGLDEMTLEQYVELGIEVLTAELADFELVSSYGIETAQGRDARILEYAAFGGALRFSQLVYLHEGTIGFNATYLALTARHEELEKLIEYSFGTFEVQPAE